MSEGPLNMLSNRLMSMKSINWWLTSREDPNKERVRDKLRAKPSSTASIQIVTQPLSHTAESQGYFICVTKHLLEQMV